MEQLNLSPMQRAKMTLTGLKISDVTLFEEWLKMGQTLREIDGCVQWWIGDWLNFGEEKYGEKYAQALDETDYEYGSLRNMKWVASKIPYHARRDKLSYSIHQEVAPLDAKDQEKILALAEKNGLSRQDVREKVRAMRYAQLDTPETPKGKYSTIVIDPPWPMEFMKLDNRPNQVEMPYPTMTIEELLTYDLVRKAAATNCNLFMWTTHTYLPDALRILEAWGFKYHVTLTWDKGNGRSLFGFNRRTEFVLYAYKGSITVKQRGKFIDTIFAEKLREHSRKPDIFYDIIRENTSGPRIDWFSREKRKGFEQFGNEEAKFNG